MLKYRYKIKEEHKMFDYKGKVVAITGASSGLGAQFALALANQGAKVAVCARRLEKLEAVKAKVEALGAECIAVKLDVTDEASVKECVATVENKWGRIDILCNNAGVSIYGDLLSYPTEDWDKVMNTNLKSMFLMSREVGKVMAKNHYGKIINTASVGGHSGAANQISYYASKGGVVNFTRALAADMAPHGVTVNCIGPGVFDTEMTLPLIAIHL